MKKKIVLLITCVLIMAGVTQAAVLYQSDFTGADLGAATASDGVGGAWVSGPVHDSG